MKKAPKLFSRFTFTGVASLSVACLLTIALLAVNPARAQETPTQPRPAQPSNAPPASSSPASNRSALPVPTVDASAPTNTPSGKAFHSPKAAAAALYEAARSNDTTELIAILGPEGRDLIESGDDQNDGIAEQRQLFVRQYDKMHRLVKELDDTVALYVGAENWPLPIPIVEYNGAWYFDTELGKQEILYRRLGRNEIEALDVSRALVDAEKEYYGVAHVFTAKFASSAKAHDGLYWQSSNTDTNTRSPIGPYLAQAGVADSIANHQPFHGYYYRILLQNQNPIAPDSDHRSSASPANSSPFAIVAFPAEYRSSGVMTFLMDENGQAYEKDLGATSASSALQIASLHLDNSWHKVE